MRLDATDGCGLQKLRLGPTDDVISISVDFMFLVGRGDGVISKAAGGKLADPYVPQWDLWIRTSQLGWDTGPQLHSSLIL